MSNESMLAAVRAAATDPAPKLDAPTVQTKESTTMTDMKTADAPANPTFKSAAELSAAYPELCSTIRTEGATAERTRITGIEKIGTQMKGHEALIAEMKADPAVTPEAAAMRIVGAESALRESQLKGIKDVEDKTGMVAAAPSAAPNNGNQPKFEQTPDGWKAEYAASEKLQAEYPTVDSYVATKRRESMKVVA